MRIRSNEFQSTLHRLQFNNEKLIQKKMTELSTGLRINSASDDSAGLAISERIRAAINQNKKQIQNMNDYLSKAQLMDSTLQGIIDLLQRIRELTVQINNGTLNEIDRASIINEKKQLIETINNLALNSRYNGKKAIDFESGVILDGNRDYAIINKKLLSPTMTLQFTVKPEMNKIMHYLHASEGPTGDGYGIENEINFSFHPDALTNFFLQTNGTINVQLKGGGGSVPIGEWSNVAVVIDSSSKKAAYYINATKIQEAPIIGTIDFTNYEDYMLIGMSKSASFDRDYGGMIKDVFIYDKALTQEELQKNIDGDIVLDGLKGYWTFQEIAGKKSEDKSGNKNTAFLFGDATFYLDFDENSDLNEIDNALDKIMKLRVENGAKTLGYGYEIDFLTNKTINESESSARIKEADVVSSMSFITKLQIKEQYINTMFSKYHSYHSNAVQLLMQ